MLYLYAGPASDSSCSLVRFSPVSSSKMMKNRMLVAPLPGITLKNPLEFFFICICVGRPGEKQTALHFSRAERSLGARVGGINTRFVRRTAPALPLWLLLRKVSSFSTWKCEPDSPRERLHLFHEGQVACPFFQRTRLSQSLPVVPITAAVSLILGPQGLIKDIFKKYDFFL